MSTYTYCEDSGYDETFEAPDDEAATAYARDLLASGDYGIIEKTTRVGAVVIADRYDDPSWRVTADLEPAETPCCGQDGHDWQDGPEYASGGGVRFTDRCGNCGTARTTDTWDCDPRTGEVMRTVRYEQASA